METQPILKQVIGFTIYPNSVICLDCYGKLQSPSPEYSLAIFGGKDGGKCFLCKHKLNRIAKDKVYSWLVAWQKSEAFGGYPYYSEDETLPIHIDHRKPYCLFCWSILHSLILH